MSAAEMDQLAILLDSLTRNEAAFRRQGQICCADQAKDIATRLATAMRKASNA